MLQGGSLVENALRSIEARQLHSWKPFQIFCRIQTLLLLCVCEKAAVGLPDMLGILVLSSCELIFWFKKQNNKKRALVGNREVSLWGTISTGQGRLQFFVKAMSVAAMWGGGREKLASAQFALTPARKGSSLVSPGQKAMFVEGRRNAQNQYRVVAKCNFQWRAVQSGGYSIGVRTRGSVPTSVANHG